MTGPAWLTLAVVALMIGVLVWDVVAPSVAVLGAVIVLLAVRVIAPADALAGLANPAVVTVAALYVLAAGVRKTGALEPLVRAALGDGSGRRGPLARLTVAVGSRLFLNDTPMVAMFAPLVADWAERNGRAPSEFLIPLSYATILGGVVTLLGTSTNLVVSGLLEASGRAPLGLFEQTAVGLPVALVGIVLIVVLAPVVLPRRASPRGAFRRDLREFVVTMEVVPGGPLEGRAVAEGGLRNLQGVFLLEVVRGDEDITPVNPGTVLRGGDRLTFVGRSDLVVDLQAMRGLRSTEEEHLQEFSRPGHAFAEAVIGPASPLVGRTIKEAGFRATYQAGVVAVHRAGHRVRAKLGSVRLRVGDTLLLLADPDWVERWRDREAFLLVSRVGEGRAVRAARAGGKAWVALVMVLAVVGVSAAGVLPLLQASLLGALGLVALGVLSPGEARSAVDLDVMLVLAASLGLAHAIEGSGLAGHAAAGVLAVTRWGGALAALVAVMVLVMVLGAVVTHIAAVALVFPIAMSAAAVAGGDARAFAVALAVAGSASFLTPIGHQVNTMVYGMGGYRFGDYARLGVPLSVAVISITIAAVALGRIW